jgi:hypothetical protein
MQYGNYKMINDICGDEKKYAEEITLFSTNLNLIWWFCHNAHKFEPYEGEFEEAHALLFRAWFFYNESYNRAIEEIYETDIIIVRSINENYNYLCENYNFYKDTRYFKSMIEAFKKIYKLMLADENILNFIIHCKDFAEIIP